MARPSSIRQFGRIRTTLFDLIAMLAETSADETAVVATVASWMAGGRLRADSRAYGPGRPTGAMRLRPCP